MGTETQHAPQTSSHLTSEPSTTQLFVHYTPITSSRNDFVKKKRQDLKIKGQAHICDVHVCVVLSFHFVQFVCSDLPKDYRRWNGVSKELFIVPFKLIE